jgi:hypothetical protein
MSNAIASRWPGPGRGRLSLAPAMQLAFPEND